MTIESVEYGITVSGGVPMPLTLKPPKDGYTSYKAVVISNYSPFVAYLTGTDDTAANVPTLPPYTANKFPYTNKSGPIEVTFGSLLTQQGVIPDIIAQFSDDPAHDFKGEVYPTALPVAVPSSANVTQVGGGTSTTRTTVVHATSGVLLLGSTPPTEAYRLQRAVWESGDNGTTVFRARLYAVAGTYSAFFNPAGVLNDNLEGAIQIGSAFGGLVVENLSPSVDVFLTLWYDIIQAPNII